MREQLLRQEGRWEGYGLVASDGEGLPGQRRPCTRIPGPRPPKGVASGSPKPLPKPFDRHFLRTYYVPDPVPGQRERRCEKGRAGHCPEGGGSPPSSKDKNLKTNQKENPKQQAMP